MQSEQRWPQIIILLSDFFCLIQLYKKTNENEYSLIKCYKK